jgi:tripartite-type tricarboxylate transporter receptor subunit TctC
MAPASLPPAITARLTKETIDILNSTEMKETFAQQGFTPDPGTPDALTAQIRGDIMKWRDVIAKAGIKPE